MRRQSYNSGNVLIIVLVYFTLATSAITLIYTNALVANRSYRSNETAISDRLELEYIANTIKLLDLKDNPVNMNFSYKQSQFGIVASPQELDSLWKISITVTKNTCDYHIISTFDSENRCFNSFEFDD